MNNNSLRRIGRPTDRLNFLPPSYNKFERYTYFNLDTYLHAELLILPRAPVWANGDPFVIYDCIFIL